MAAALPPALGSLPRRSISSALPRPSGLRCASPATSYLEAIDETGWQAATRLTALTARGVDLLTLL